MCGTLEAMSRWGMCDRDYMTFCRVCSLVVVLTMRPSPTPLSDIGLGQVLVGDIGYLREFNY